MDATGIGIDILSQTPNGRQTTFETRMAMQRELDEARTQLKNSERASDEQRRQAQSSREQAAVYRSENVRLQDELRSTKSRLNGALDSQEELLRKNSSLHSQIHELQNSEAALRDELTSTAGLVKHFQEQNDAIQADMREEKARFQAAEQEMNGALGNMTTTLTEMRNELLLRHAEKETLVATCEALRAEIRKKDTEILQRDTDLAAAARERSEVREELTTSHARLTTVQEAQEELRAQIAQASAAGNAKDVEINKLEQTTAVLETRVEEQQQKVAKMQAELQQHRAGGGSGGASEAQVASLQADLVQARALNKALEAKIEEAVKGPSPAPAPSPLELQNENVMLASKLEDCKCENDALLESDMLAATMAERDALTSHLVVENARLAASVSASARAASVSRVLRSRQVEVAAAAAAVNRARVRVFAPPIATASSSALGSYYKLRAEREGRLRSLERARRSGMRY